MARPPRPASPPGSVRTPPNGDVLAPLNGDTRTPLNGDTRVGETCVSATASVPATSVPTPEAREGTATRRSGRERRDETPGPRVLPGQKAVKPHTEINKADNAYLNPGNTA
ncbi:hypothetical protein GCM10017600_53410 [Streptosporangium carneum]|uniref:Uncharacterized protein n=1 Tax=Streptosporangium carneum TaxID=47481 RepID=A0A9W6I686_9ACTN|nr:hypothetical protein GCM10017600_53410 [Streptosporangium carneum]